MTSKPIKIHLLGAPPTLVLENMRQNSQIDLSPLEKMAPKKSYFKGDKSTVVSLPKEDDFDPNEVLFIEAKQVHRSI